MPRTSAASWFLAGGLALTGLGCTQQYTGGLGTLGPKQRESVEEYRREVAQREAQLRGESPDAAGESALRGDRASRGDGASQAAASASPDDAGSSPADPAPPNVAFTSQNTDARDRRPETASLGQRRAAVMGLYGQLSARPDARVSPMDGPGNVRRVSFTHEGADFDPEVDPSGKFVVYASTRHRTESDIYLKAIDGNAVTQLTSDPAADMMPTFSPDGEKIAFASERSGNWDIYVMEARGGQSVQITDSPAHEIHPSFSPDGTQLVYCTLSQASGQWELVVVNLDNTATKTYIGAGLLPNWSPTDKRIVFQRARQRGTRWFSIWTLTYEDGEAHSPTELAASDNAACITPDWSPHGQHVVFCTVIDPQYDDGRSPTYADLWIMEEDGSNRSRLTHGQFTNLQPDWSRGGSIFFVSDRGGEGLENVFALRADQAIRVAATAGEPSERPTDTATAEVPTE